MLHIICMVFRDSRVNIIERSVYIAQGKIATPMILVGRVAPQTGFVAANNKPLPPGMGPAQREVERSGPWFF